MYLANNVIEIFLNLHSAHESHEYLSHNRDNLEPYQVGNAVREIRENYVFTLGSVCFAVGALLFEIPVYEGCSNTNDCTHCAHPKHSALSLVVPC